jgi:hypothetical protein
MTNDMTGLRERLWGCNDLDRLFVHGVPKVLCPFPRAGGLKGEPSAVQLFTQRLLESPVYLTEVDPRQLFASQNWVVREHADYYRTGTWELTGVTSADRDRESNRWPVVMIDRLGRHVIAAGHHRSLAALFEGRPLLARVFPSEPDTATALTPHLLVGDDSRIPHERCDTLAQALDVVWRGGTALCDATTASEAFQVVNAPPTPGYTLCTTCGGLRAEVCPTHGHFDDRCECQPREGSDDDSSEEREARLPCVLCQACGLVAVRGHSRWRMVMCEPCRERAKEFNERVGEKVLLQGIHTLVNGGPTIELTSEPLPPGVYERFAGAFKAMGNRITWFYEWGKAQRIERLRTLGFEPGRVIPVEQYQWSCDQAGITSDDGWARLEAHFLRFEPAE